MCEFAAEMRASIRKTAAGGGWSTMSCFSYFDSPAGKTNSHSVMKREKLPDKFSSRNEVDKMCALRLNNVY